MRLVTSTSLVLGVLCIFGVQVHADAAIKFDIPAQPAATGLNEFARQADVTLVFSYEIVSSAHTNEVRGEYPVTDALSRLIDGTALSYQDLGKGTIAIGAVRISGEVPDAAAESGSVARAPADVRANAETARRSFWDRFRLAQVDQGAAAGAVDSASSAGAKPEGEKLEEITVTAQKRAERLRDVPISISVLGGDDLDASSAEGIAETLNSVPGVMAQQSYIGGGTQVAIRGVAASSTILHGSSPVAYYLDSVPFGLIKTSVAPDSNAYDMERVEVLRGPQGTLYGSSALNGVVRVLTKDANLDEFELKGRASTSSTRGGSGNYRGDMALNVPLIEGKLGARAVLGYENQSGWIDRPNEKNANDAEMRNFRLKLGARPTDALSIGLSAWSSRSDYGASSMGLENGTYSTPANEPMVTDYDAYDIKVSYDFGPATLSSSSSYLDYYNFGALDNAPLGLPGVPFFNSYYAHVFAQEINLSSAVGERWRWSVGGIYRDERDRTFQQIPGIFPADVNFFDTSKSYAVFGEVTRMFADRRYELTLGLRYFKDDVGTNEASSWTGVPNTPLVDVSSNFSKTTPRVVFTWHPSELVTAYASYAEGFRSGFQQQPNVFSTAPEIPPVEADSLKNYEVGAKGTWLDGRLNLDLAAYYIDWQDVQTDNAILIANIPVVGLINGDSASGVGLDVGLSLQPMRGLDLGLTFSWNDLQWDNDVVAASGFRVFAKGDRLNLSPEYTAGASIDYSFPLGASGYQGRLSSSANYTSQAHIIGALPGATGFGDPILIARASASIEAPAHWTLMVYGDNLNNERGIIQQAPFAVADWSVRPRPRTIGVQLSYRL